MHPKNKSKEYKVRYKDDLLEHNIAYVTVVRKKYGVVVDNKEVYLDETEDGWSFEDFQIPDFESIDAFRSKSIVQPPTTETSDVNNPTIQTNANETSYTNVTETKQNVG